MASTMYGADVAELRALSDRISRSADDLDRIARLLTNQITSTTAWVGPSAQRFRGAWAGTHRGSIGVSVRALRECAAALRHNADQQAGASAADASSVAGLAGGLSAAASHNISGFTVDPNFAAVISDVALPQLKEAYERLTTVQSGIDLLKAVKILKSTPAGKLPLMSIFTGIYDIASTGPQTMSDLQSGDTYRVSQAVFRTGWTVAKALVPSIAIADTVFSIGLVTGKVIADGVGGPGTSELALRGMGQQFDQAGHEVGRVVQAAAEGAAKTVVSSVMNLFHL